MSVEATLNVCGVTLLVIRLKDRSRKPLREVKWLFQKQWEELLFGANTSAINQLLARQSFSSTTLLLQRSCVGKLVTEAEYAALFEALRSTLPIETRMKVRMATLVPLSVVQACCQAYGRNDRTTELLTALRGMGCSMPRAWELAIEAEKDEAAGEHDLLLHEELQELEDQDEQLELSLASEIALDYVSYKPEPEDDAKIPALSPVPHALELQFAEYEKHRLSPFCRYRAGGAVAETTISGDRGSGLRFFGYVVSVHNEAADLKLLAGPRIGELAQQWLEHLRAAPRSLKGSSLANYMQSVIQLSAFANSLLDEGAADPPTQQLLNLRKQVRVCSPPTPGVRPQHCSRLPYPVFDSCGSIPTRVHSARCWRSRTSCLPSRARIGWTGRRCSSAACEPSSATTRRTRSPRSGICSSSASTPSKRQTESVWCGVCDSTSRSIRTRKASGS